MNLRCFNPQFFVASKVGDLALEQDLRHSVRGYEQDLRVVIEAVRALCGAVPPGALSPVDLLALDRLEALGRSAGSSPTEGEGADRSLPTADVDDLILKLQRLREEDPEGVGQIVRRIVDEAGPPSDGPE